jgi:hypothetical protein
MERERERVEMPNELIFNYPKRGSEIGFIHYIRINKM